MLRFLMVSLFSAAVFAARDENSLRTEWKAFKAKHGRNYLDGPEDEFRFKIFAENMRLITEHNEGFRRGVVSYRLGMNHFGDKHRDELIETYSCGDAARNDGRTASYLPPVNVDVRRLPRHVDWRKRGYVTPVKQQGDCNSCWAFSATGSLEGQHFRKTGKLVSLSEQNLVDCVIRDYRGPSCYRGNPWTAFDYIRDNGGIDTEESYPYVARKQQCKFKRSDVGANLTTYVMLNEGSEEQLKIAVATVGPVSTFIDPHFETIWFYRDNIVDAPSCSTTNLTHVVLVVGYGVKHGKKYWLIKNSWGTGWGDNGYAMIAREKNMCGIASLASYPVV